MKKGGKKSEYRAQTIALEILILLLLSPLFSFAQRGDAIRSVNDLLNYASRSDTKDYNRSFERSEQFMPRENATPMAHTVLGAIAQTAGSRDTLRQRTEAISEPLREVIIPSQIASQVLKEREESKEREREREQKFQEKFGDRQQKDRSALISQITNFNDGRESRGKALERLALNKIENGRSEKGEKNKDSKSASDTEKSEAKSDAKVETKVEPKADEKGSAGQADDRKSEDKKPEDKKEDNKDKANKEDRDKKGN